MRIASASEAEKIESRMAIIAVLLVLLLATNEPPQPVRVISWPTAERLRATRLIFRRQSTHRDRCAGAHCGLHTLAGSTNRK